MGSVRTQGGVQVYRCVVTLAVRRPRYGRMTGQPFQVETDLNFRNRQNVTQFLVDRGERTNTRPDFEARVFVS